MNSNSDKRSLEGGAHPSHAWTNTLKPGAFTDRPAFEEAMRHPAYPLSCAYDPAWAFLNSMGPVSLWQAEELAPRLALKPGQRVLDLGCGAAASSIFLAREFDVEVWAADLWIDPGDNWQRIKEAGVTGKVFPISAEAHRLPFAREIFDAVVSIDAYHYFGTDLRYLTYLAQFVKVGGRIGIAVPGNSVDPGDPGAMALPEELAAQLGADWYTFRSPDWWRRHWSCTRCVDVEHAAMVAGGRDSWRRCVEATAAWQPRAAEQSLDGPMLASEAGKTLGFCTVLARRNAQATSSFGPGAFVNRIA